MRTGAGTVDPKSFFDVPTAEQHAHSTRYLVRHRIENGDKTLNAKKTQLP